MIVIHSDTMIQESLKKVANRRLPKATIVSCYCNHRDIYHYMIFWDVRNAEEFPYPAEHREEVLAYNGELTPYGVRWLETHAKREEERNNGDS